MFFPRLPARDSKSWQKKMKKKHHLRMFSSSQHPGWSSWKITCPLQMFSVAFNPRPVKSSHSRTPRRRLPFPWEEAAHSSGLGWSKKNLEIRVLGVFKNSGTPKWMVYVYFMENPLKKWMIWGCSHYFRKHPYSVTWKQLENCVEQNSKGKAKVFKNDHFLGMFTFGVSGYNCTTIFLLKASLKLITFIVILLMEILHHLGCMKC